MKKAATLIALILIMMSTSCMQKPLEIEVYETSESGNKLTLLNDFKVTENASQITIDISKEYQTITGFGGSFTEASATVLNQISKESRNRILNAYFSKQGARYSLTRTHMNSCDFSLNNYSYTPVAGDKNLEHFSIQEDKDDLIPMIKDAMAISEDASSLYITSTHSRIPSRFWS